MRVSAAPERAIACLVLGSLAALLAAWIPAAAQAAAAPSTAAAAQPARPSKAVRLAYRYKAREVIRQTTRMTQVVTSEQAPALAGESVSVGHAQIRVIEVDANGTSTLDEIVVYDDLPDQRDFKRMRTTRLGEVVWVDVVKGDPSTLQGGALFVDRPVRPGETWRTSLTGGGSASRYRIALDVTFAALADEGGRRVASLDLNGSMDPADLTTMLGTDAVSHALSGKGCKVTGAVKFDVDAGREISSRIELDCAIEQKREGKPAAPVALSLVYDTTAEGDVGPYIPAP